jgi:hypothetical protein
MKLNKLILILVFVFFLCFGSTSLFAFENYKFLSSLDTVPVPYASKLAIADNTLYVYGDSILSVYSANNISRPTKITEFKTNEDLNSIQPIPPYNVLVIGPMELSLKENTDLNTTGRIFRIQTFAGSNAVREGTNLYVANSDTGMEIINLANGNMGRTVSYFHDYYGLKSIDVKWPMVYALNKFGFVIIDVSDLENPVAKGTNYQILDAKCIAVKDTFALIGTKNSLIVMSIKNPDKPFIVSQVPYPYPVQNIRINNTDAFVCIGKGGLRVIDFSRPKKPIETNSFKGKDRIFDVAFNDEYVYVADGKGGIRILLYH